MTGPSYFSVLRWRSDPTRDEARNIAVVVVDATGEQGGIRSAPISSVSPRLHDQGIVDAVLRSLETQFASAEKPSIEDLNDLQRKMSRSLIFTSPRPVATVDVDATLSALYEAYARPRIVQSSAKTKGRVLDDVVSFVRRRGLGVRRGHYVQSFLFDLVTDDSSTAGQVLSFASGARTALPAEKDAGHFLYGLGRTGLRGVSIIEPPTQHASPTLLTSHERVIGWMGDEGVPVISPEELRDADRLGEVFPITPALMLR